MAKGKRLAVLNAAQLPWVEDLDGEQYVETGRIGDDPQDEVIPFNPALRTEIIKQWGQ